MRVGVQSLGQRAFAPAATESDLDVRAVGGVLWRKRAWIVIPTLAAALLALVTVQLITPKYKSEARVLFDGRENIYLRPEVDKSTVDRNTSDPEAVASQMQLVLSRDLAHQVIEGLKLGGLPEFDPLVGGASLPRELLGFLGLAKDPLRMTPEERVLESYYEKLNVYPIDKSRVIVIEFTSHDPDLAARAANAIAQAYLTFQQANKQEQARSAGQWLSGEIDKLRRKVSDAEAKVEDFRGKSNLFLGNNNTSLSTQQLAELSTQLASARGQKADAEVRARLIREALKAGRAVESADLANSELLRRLTEQRVTLRAQLAEQSSTLLDGHPRIKELKAQIGDLERQIREEADKVGRALENDSQIAGARVEALTANLEQLKRQANSNNEGDVQLRALEREAKAQRDLLESYLAKYREATTRETIDAGPADARIISRAVVTNTPAFPKKLPIVLIATLATFVLCAGFVTTGALLNSASITSEPNVDVASAAAPAPAPSAMAAAVRPLTAPPLGSAEASARPEVTSPLSGRTVRDVGSFDGTHPALTVPVSSIEDVAQSLRAAGGSGRRVTLVGALRNVGTTMTALTLARTLARDAKVVLVDLTLGTPEVSVISSEPAAPGIADVVRGTASFGQIITRDKLSSLHLVGAGRTADDAAAILASQRLATTIEALARTYDHVVLDAGAVPEIMADRFARLAPKAVLVAAGPDHAATKAARERLMGAGFADITVLVPPQNGPQAPADAA
jgi:succinoglycan biosynthesis transport protein ExoP